MREIWPSYVKTHLLYAKMRHFPLKCRRRLNKINLILLNNLKIALFILAMCFVSFKKM